MRLFACDGRVILEDMSGEERARLVGGSSIIALPDNMKAEYVPARVLEIGECQTIPGGIKYKPKFVEGDIVFYSKSMSSQLLLGGKTYVLVDYAYVGGVLK